MRVIREALDCVRQQIVSDPTSSYVYRVPNKVARVPPTCLAEPGPRHNLITLESRSQHLFQQTRTQSHHLVGRDREEVA